VKILVSNDDGYLAEGINILAKRLRRKHQVTIFAPTENKSASSSSLTIDKPLKPEKYLNQSTQSMELQVIVRTLHYVVILKKNLI